jgi:hypothetical protein
MNNEDIIFLGNKILESTFEHYKMAVGIWPQFCCLAPLSTEITQENLLFNACHSIEL